MKVPDDSLELSNQLSCFVVPPQGMGWVFISQQVLLQDMQHQPHHHSGLPAQAGTTCKIRQLRRTSQTVHIGAFAEFGDLRT